MGRKNRRPKLHRWNGDIPTPMNESLSDINLIGYEITSEPLIPPNEPKLSPQTKDLYDRAFHLSSREKKYHEAAIAFERLIAENPNMGRFYNNLAVCYDKLGEDKKAKALIEKNYQCNPQYLFAKVDYAHLCIARGQLSKVPQIFGGKFNLKLIYPDRNIFHVQEVAAFKGVIATFFAKIGKHDAALMYLHVLKKIMPNHPSISIVQLLCMPQMLENAFQGTGFGILNRKKVPRERCDGAST